MAGKNGVQGDASIVRHRVFRGQALFKVTVLCDSSLGLKKQDYGTA